MAADSITMSTVEFLLFLHSTMATVFKRGGKKAKGNYYASWTDHSGKRRTKCTFTTDKATAERIAKKYEADAALRRDGVIDPTLDAISKESRRSIESHLIDYEAKLNTASRGRQHVRSTLNYIRAIAEFGGFSIASDIAADSVNRYAQELRDLGRSARTVEAYLTAIKGFTKWLTEHHKLPRDPLASVKKPNPKADRRRERRMLLPEEWWWLEATTRISPGRFGMRGIERVLLYRIAIETGLRSGELRSLTQGRLFLDPERPFITCKSRSTKNAKDARQYIQVDAAVQLGEHTRTKTPGAVVFTLPEAYEMADMLRADLRDARTAWIDSTKHDPEEQQRRAASDFLADVNHDGEVIDFHSLRHTCGAWLAMSGAHPKVVQQVMRHSTITLTMDTYGHLFPGQEADAVAGLDQFFPQATEDQAATGTDGRAQRLAQRLGRETRRSDATVCDDSTNSAAQKKTPKPLCVADLGDIVRPDATGSESAPSRTRTLNLLIKSRFRVLIGIWYDVDSRSLRTSNTRCDSKNTGRCVILLAV